MTLRELDSTCFYQLMSAARGPDCNGMAADELKARTTGIVRAALEVLGMEFPDGTVITHPTADVLKTAPTQQVKQLWHELGHFRWHIRIAAIMMPLLELRMHSTALQEQVLALDNYEPR